MKKTLAIEYDEYASKGELPIADQELIEAAQRATEGSYSPYSHFRVGAAVRMKDGTIEIGSNQENLAYPSGLCAERVALFGASARYGKDCIIKALAIAAVDGEGKAAEASPCGACRQVMIEQEQRQGCNMRILLPLNDGSVREYNSASDLLPFVFAAEL
ncbi:MAG: cytidine deaminase [Bacteroidales bacterium]|nr:cytidine deaminase [Bacteroidales bacterium]